MPKSETFCADCLPALKQYPEGYFDLAVVDPPYGGGFTEGGGCKGWFEKYHQTNNRELGAHFVGRGRSKRYQDEYDDYSQIVHVERERETPGGRSSTQQPATERARSESLAQNRQLQIRWEI